MAHSGQDHRVHVRICPESGNARSTRALIRCWLPLRAILPAAACAARRAARPYPVSGTALGHGAMHTEWRHAVWRAAPASSSADPTLAWLAQVAPRRCHAAPASRVNQSPTRPHTAPRPQTPSRTCVGCMAAAHGAQQSRKSVGLQRLTCSFFLPFFYCFWGICF